MVPHLTGNARGLRRHQTDVEAKLWQQLRDRRLAGLKFKRQVPRGFYIADFLCDEAMLIVELDGSQHGEQVNIAKDEERTKYLEQLGYLVLRFWNSEVNQAAEGVVETIYREAVARQKAPSSGLRPPSPQGEKAMQRHPTPNLHLDTPSSKK